MGDRFDSRRRGRLGERIMPARGKPPPTILAWGLGEVARIGHNNGPPLDEEPGYRWRRYRWTKAHAAAWKTPSLAVVRFRVARAEAAGLSYHEYVATLLDTGRFAQARDRDQARLAALARVRAAWAEVWPRLAPDALRMNAAIVLGALTAAYDEEARAYHTLVHLAAVLDDLVRYGQHVADRDALIMAALFHDAVYDARRHDNEEASARLAALHLTDLGVDPLRVGRIAELILATRHREADVAAAEAEAEGDTALLLDCDLAVLAAEPMRYRAYAAAIRREYAHVPDAAFRAGRARLLHAFLARRRLYATPRIRALWEAQARANVAAEIADLVGGEGIEPPTSSV